MISREEKPSRFVAWRTRSTQDGSKGCAGMTKSSVRSSLQPVASTSGGTSDARFVKDHCPVLEFGLVGHFMHQVDERVPAEQVRQLARIYRRILERYFA